MVLHTRGSRSGGMASSTQVIIVLWSVCRILAQSGRRRAADQCLHSEKERTLGSASNSSSLQLRTALWEDRAFKKRESVVASGTVKWFNPTKGYGFIQPSTGGGKDVFIHISAVEKAGLSTLNEGQQVEYDLIPNKGKESAENLKLK